VIHNNRLKIAKIAKQGKTAISFFTPSPIPFYLDEG
jgi:hypothetical protein